MNQLFDDHLDLERQLAELETTMKAVVIGQDDAIDAIMGSLERYQAGLHDEKRPIGTFLFMGPTGVGKTYTVEKLAELTQTPDAYIRIDCSEFSLDHEVAKLLGSPPGYTGHETGSTLSRAIDAIKHPENGFILLIDEIEKAHPKFFDLWLQVMDAGILTDSKGKKLDFTRALVFFTSNVGASHYSASSDIGFRPSRPNDASLNSRVTAELKKTFRPEFINRLSGQVIFQSLDELQEQKIFSNLLSDLNTRLSRYYITVGIGTAMRQQLFTKGFSREYGARELKRAMVKYLEQPLARAIIRREIPEDSRIKIDLDESGKFVVERFGQYPILLEETVNHL
jgi:ATP-dependent Clp protease ATP-binding subunit ClpA